MKKSRGEHRNDDIRPEERPDRFGKGDLWLALLVSLTPFLLLRTI